MTDVLMREVTAGSTIDCTIAKSGSEEQHDCTVHKGCSIVFAALIALGEGIISMRLAKPNAIDLFLTLH